MVMAGGECTEEWMWNKCPGSIQAETHGPTIPCLTRAGHVKWRQHPCSGGRRCLTQYGTTRMTVAGSKTIKFHLKIRRN